jgi:prepilin-type N-terminal cleavage/methylation domain-containing protein
MRRGYTLAELLIVIAIIAALMAILFPLLSSIRAQADIAATRLLIQGAASRMASFGTSSITCRDGTARRAWAIGQVPGDSEIDGDPRLYPVAHPLATLAPPEYIGFVAMTGFTPTCGVNARGQVLDRWRRPLHIIYAAYAYLPDGRGLWSTGPRGVGDEINSWTNAEK